MLKAENKSQTKLKYFTFNLKINSYCYHKWIRTLTFASVYSYKTKYNWKLHGAVVN